MSLNREGNSYSIVFHPVHNPGLLVWNLFMGRKVSFCPKPGSCWVLLKTSTYQRSLDANSMEYKNPDKTLQLCSEMKKQQQDGLKSTAQTASYTSSPWVAVSLLLPTADPRPPSLPWPWTSFQEALAWL